MTPEEYEAKKAARIERLRARSERAARASASSLNRAHEIGSRIPMGQPILVGHHSEKRHRRDIARIDSGMRKGFALADESKAFEHRAARAESSTAVSSDDPAAVAKLEEKLAGLERDQERMKKANKAVRSGASVQKLAEVTGLSEANAAKLFEKDFAGRVGFPPYALTNAGSEIRRVKARIAELRAKASAPVRATETIGEIRIEENDNRVRMFFPSKPDDATRTALKRQGFRWSPTEGAWQRMASNQAWYWAREIAGKLAGQSASPRPGATVRTEASPRARFDIAPVPAIAEIHVPTLRGGVPPERLASARTATLFDLGPSTPTVKAEKPKKKKAQTDWLSVFGIKK